MYYICFSRVVPTFGTIQTSGTQNMSLAAMKRRIPSRHNPPDDLPPFLQTFQVCVIYSVARLPYNEIDIDILM